jgi:hypothetical protein
MQWRWERNPERCIQGKSALGKERGLQAASHRDDAAVIERQTIHRVEAA